MVIFSSYVKLPEGTTKKMAMSYLVHVFFVLKNPSSPAIDSALAAHRFSRSQAGKIRHLRDTGATSGTWGWKKYDVSNVVFYMDLPNTKNLGFLLDGLYTQTMKMVMAWGYLGDMVWFTTFKAW